MTSCLPPVSIGIPFFNAADDLLDAVRSVFAQTHTDWELILIDDGSSDQSLALAQSIDDPRVSVHYDGQNRRLAARLNEIARLAKYDFVARMDADDFIDPTRLERQLGLLVANPDLDLVSTGVYSLDNDNRPYGRRCMPKGYTITPKSLLAGNCGIVNASVVARRDWFLRNPFNETLKRAQDANLWVQAYDRGDLRALILDEPLYYYREDNNVSEKRILASYQVTRYSILKDAKQRYRLADRVQAYGKSLIKSAIIWTLARLGKMDIIRKQRIAQPLSQMEQDHVRQTIADIQATPLPLNASGR